MQVFTKSFFMEFEFYVASEFALVHLTTSFLCFYCYNDKVADSTETACPIHSLFIFQIYVVFKWGFGVLGFWGFEFSWPLVVKE